LLAALGLIPDPYDPPPYELNQWGNRPKYRPKRERKK